MRSLIIIFILFLLSHCSKPKTVLICGDHVCINNAEAEQFFLENLSIEVKVVKKKTEKKIDLVELNLSENISGKRKVKVFKKNKTNKKLKKLSKKEKKNIKKNIQKFNKRKELAKKIIKKNDNKQKIRLKENQIKKNEKSKVSKKNVDKRKKEVVDVCTIIKKCNIEEISKYLLNEGINKEYPDITQKDKFE